MKGSEKERKKQRESEKEMKIIVGDVNEIKIEMEK
jgi:hypothetical protein